MAKRKKKGRAKVICPGCGAKMGKRDVACRRCGQGRMGYFKPGPPGASKVFQPAGAPPFIAKSAKPAKPRCGRCGRASRAGARHCTSCGSPFLALVSKSAGQVLREELAAEWRLSPDPATREGAWQALYGEHLDGGAVS